MNTNRLKPRRGRPPKNLRDNQDTKALLIRSGLEHLTEFGFANSGIDPILKKVGVPKGSFYHYFSSKEAFGLAVLNQYALFFAKKLDTFLLDESKPALIRLENFMQSAQQGMARYSFKRGCLVGNLGQEIDLLPESFRPKLNNIFRSWQQRVETCLLQAQQEGSINSDLNCEALAECFWIGWEGAVSRARLVQSGEPLKLYSNYFIAGLRL